MKRNLAAAVLFQGVWFAAVLGGAQGLDWPGVSAALLFLGLGWWWPGFLPRLAWPAFVLWPLLGYALDAVPIICGWLSYSGPAAWPKQLAPLWIAALWWSFLPLFPGALAWMRDRYWISVSFGAIGAPLSYLGGERLGALVMEERVLALAWIAVVWGTLTPLWVQRLALVRPQASVLTKP